MSTKTKAIARPLATLNLTKKVPDLIAFGRRVVQAMEGNPHFPSPNPTLAVLTTAIDDLSSAQTAALARTHGAVTARDAKRTTVVALLQQVRAYVQSVADGSSEDGATIIESAGLKVRKAQVRTASSFAAKAANVTGSVKLTAPSAARRAGYEWEYSTDNGVTWITTPVTLQARTTVSGLKAGTTVLFRYRPVLKTGEENWSAPVPLLVQ